ncbi:MAG TPA: hypothetical protein VN842_02285 [Thermoplasmata archaeon]|nr:hypothetical protein [Thermoplasmata archaeon]
MLKGLAGELGSDLSVALHNLPRTPFPAHSQAAAEATEPADTQGKYCWMHDRRFEYPDPVDR